MPERRWAWVEVDTAAIQANVRKLKALTPADTRFMAVVKADGYGHGAVEAARAVLEAGAEMLGVATVEEALELRTAGVSAPVFLLAEAPPDAAGDLVENGIITTIATRDFAEAMSAAADRVDRAADVHLKVDTGMHRVGIDHTRAGEFLTSLRGLPGLRLSGVLTHFATSEVPGDWDFETQMKRFDESLTSIKEAGFDPGIVHAANSGATILHPESHFDMVRCGIAVYGLHPGDATRDAIDLQPAMRVVARVAAVRRVAMGEGVSYGLTWRAAAPTTVATIPLGYADGIHRILSDRMRVLIGGHSCAQVGRVCMDQFMVEVPRGADVEVGDEVVVVGSQGDEEITLDEQARCAETINYEMACGYGLRLPRTPARGAARAG